MDSHPENLSEAQQQINNKITIDPQLLKHKEELLNRFYQVTNDPDWLAILSEWPTTSIQQSVAREGIVIRTNNAKYVGETCNEMFHGYGLLIYDEPQNDRFYEGEFQNNCKHGSGFEYIRGDVYLGKFVNNKPEDSNGAFLWKNGDFFMGAFVNGMKHGEGRWESGEDYYEGTWKLNRPEGKGSIHTAVSDYEGEVKSGYKHGRGIQIFSNGDRYEGHYANGKPEGDGFYSWNNGAIYKGQFKNGIRYGYGEWVYGSEKYEGDYVNDKRNGQGVYKWGNSSYYKGEFVDDMRHGFGQMHWGEDTFYRGQWREGIQAGQGELWEEGRLASKGHFQDGKFVKQPEKLERSRHSHNPNEHRKTRYPAIQKRDKTRISSYTNSHHNNSRLGQIEQLPKTIKQKRLAAVSTSFSNNGRKSISNNASNFHSEVPKGGKINEIHKPNHQNFMRGSIKKEPMHRNPSATKNNKVFKKRIMADSKAPSKSIGMNVEMNDTQLGPIKWRNFTHVKNQAEANLPHL